jgi:hypothetical protein
MSHASQQEVEFYVRRSNDVDDPGMNARGSVMRLLIVRREDLRLYQRFRAQFALIPQSKWSRTGARPSDAATASAMNQIVDAPIVVATSGT